MNKDVDYFILFYIPIVSLLPPSSSPSNQKPNVSHSPRAFDLTLRDESFSQILK